MARTLGEKNAESASQSGKEEKKGRREAVLEGGVKRRISITLELGNLLWPKLGSYNGGD